MPVYAREWAVVIGSAFYRVVALPNKENMTILLGHRGKKTESVTALHFSFSYSTTTQLCMYGPSSSLRVISPICEWILRLKSLNGCVVTLLTPKSFNSFPVSHALAFCVALMVLFAPLPFYEYHRDLYAIVFL